MSRKLEFLPRTPLCFQFFLYLWDKLLLSESFSEPLACGIGLIAVLFFHLKSINKGYSIFLSLSSCLRDFPLVIRTIPAISNKYRRIRILPLSRLWTTKVLRSFLPENPLFVLQKWGLRIKSHWNTALMSPLESIYHRGKDCFDGRHIFTIQSRRAEKSQIQ